MKSIFNKDTDPEIETDEELDQEEVDVDDSGPSIAAAQKNKLLIILASAGLIFVVFYMMFFKTEEKKPLSLEEVEVIPTTDSTSVTSSRPSEGAPAALTEQQLEIGTDNADIFDKPAVPEIPDLPQLPDDDELGDDINPTIKSDKVKRQDSVLGTNIPNVPAQENKPAEAVMKGDLPAVSGIGIPSSDNSKGIEANDPRYAPIVVISGSAGPASSVGYENNIVDLNKNPIDALEKSEPQVTASYIDDRAHTIAQGKLLTAILETAINTEIPGFVRAIISRDVYGEAGNKVLIPRGSRLFGSYSSQIQRGQGRVKINWTRLIRPDGVNLNIAFMASDQFGRAGIDGEVDNKYGSIITNSILASILTLGTAIAAEQLSGNSSNNSSSTTTNLSQGTVTTTGKASNQIIYNLTDTIVDTLKQVVSNKLNTSPVIRVPQGTRITVVVNADIKIPDMR